MDREMAIGRIKAIKTLYALTHMTNEALDLAIEALEDPEIVRCGECKNYKATSDPELESYCYIDGRAEMTPDGYCSWGEKKQVTGKLKNPDDSLLTDDSEACKEQKSKLDCISRDDAIAYIDRVTNSGLGKNKSLDYIRKYIYALPPVTPTDKVQQADTLIIATALQDLAQNSKRNISDRERAEELREQVLAYGASMCKPVTPTERTGEWIRRKDGGATCSRCGVMLGKGQWTNYDGIPDYYCCKCGAKMKGGTENE